MPEKTFYLVAGVNGSGKTTLARELVSMEDGMLFLNADEIARIHQINSVQAGRILLNELDTALKSDKSFILETTLSGHYHTRVAARARAYGFKIVFLYIMLASVEQNLARIRQRVALGGHDIPEDVVRRRYNRSIINFGDMYHLSDHWEFYYNGDKKYRIIARGTSSSIEIIDGQAYDFYMAKRDLLLSRDILHLANRGAARAQQEAAAAGVPIVYQKLGNQK